jgi:hypothetical protein
MLQIDSAERTFGLILWTSTPCLCLVRWVREAANTTQTPAEVQKTL